MTRKYWIAFLVAALLGATGTGCHRKKFCRDTETSYREPDCCESPR